MEKKNNLSFLYEKNRNHITAPISGAWGGVSPDGKHIIMSVYLDQVTLPNYQNINIVDNQPDFSNPENVSRGDFTREVFGTFTMSSETAKSIANWLLQKAEGLDNAKQK
ncbi:MAG: hypothetical protein FJ214_11650 [Ignavibacteria bacterium]|nr:hypothetical protein [Ignavibacteria bacterium]